MRIKTTWLAGCLLTLAACSESQYDLDKLVPEEYHKILYVNNSGKQVLTLFNTDEDNKYTLSVIKTGSHPEQPANANIRILTQAELDEQYSTPEGINYQLISESCFSLGSTQIDLSATERYKLVEILLKPQSVKSLLESEPTAVWVLPLQVVSETDSINVTKDQLFLQIKDVIMPALGFVNTTSELKSYNYGSVSDIIVNTTIGLDTPNKWDLEWELSTDNDYVATYNAANGTSYAALPQGTYSLPASMSLSNGTTTTQLDVAIQGGQLQPGDYILPVRISQISQFEISSTKAVYPFIIRILGPQLDRTGWTGEASSEESSGEGPGNGTVAAALDGDLSTYWHSRWQGWTDGLPHEVIIDTKEEYTFSHFAMSQRQSQGNLDTKAGEFYVSSDKANWTKVGDFIMKQVLEAQIFGVTPTTGRYFKIKINYGYREPYCSLSEVYAYGK